MIHDISQLLLLALQSVTELPLSAGQKELLLNIYDSIPDTDRADIVSKVLDNCEGKAALILCSAVPDVMHLDTNAFERISDLILNALIHGQISFAIVPDVFRPERTACDYILSIAYFVLKDPMALALYSDLLSMLPKKHGGLEHIAPYNASHDVPSSVIMHLNEAVTLALRVLEPIHFILILAAWYWGTRSSLIQSPICNILEALCRQAFSSDLFNSISSEIALNSCSLLLSVISTTLRNEDIEFVDGYLNPKVKACKHLELISSFLSLAGSFLSSLLKRQPLESEHLRSILCISAYIVGLGSSAAVKRIGFFLKAVSPICGFDTTFSTALLMLLDSIESTSLHLVVPAFQRFGPQLFSCVNDAGCASLASSEHTPMSLLTYNFLHRAITLTLLPIRRFYLHILPLIAVGFISGFSVSVTLFSPQFMTCSMLPAISGLQEQRFSRSGEVHKRIAQERSRSLYVLEEGKDWNDGPAISAPYQLLKNCVFLSPENHYQATPFEDRNIEHIFPLTDAFVSSVSSAIDETLENIAIGYYALARKYNNLCAGSPLVTDNTVYRTVLLQMLLQSVSDRHDPVTSLSNLCIVMAASSRYVFPSVLFIVITCATSVIEHCLLDQKEELEGLDTSYVYDISTGLSSRLLESFKHLYCSVLNINRIHRPFFLTLLFKLALCLSHLCNFMPSDIMAVFMHHTFQLTDLSQDSVALTRWVMLAEHRELSTFDLLVTLLLCVICKRSLPTLTYPLIDTLSVDSSFYSFLSELEHPSVAELFQALPNYVSELCSLLHDNISCIAAAKAAINTVRHGYRSTTPSDTILALHSSIWALIAPTTLFLSPITTNHVSNPKHHCLASVLNNLSLEAISYQLCTNKDAATISIDIDSTIDSWETFSGTHTASFFDVLSSICLACMRSIQQSRSDKDSLERWAQLTCEACEMVFRIVNSEISGGAKGIYLHLASKALFSEHVIEALWLLHVSNSVHYPRLLLVIRRFFTCAYLFISMAPIYSSSIMVSLVSSIHSLIFNRVDTLLRSHFVETELLDMILCLALYIPYDGVYYEVEDASSIIIQTGLVRYYEQVDKSACISDTSFFADYRVRKSAIGLLQLLTCHLAPLGLIKSLLTKNTEPSAEALELRGKNLLKENPMDIRRGKKRIDVSKLPDCIFSDLYRSLFIPLLEAQKELSVFLSVSQLKQLTLLRILRMLASITYHNRPYGAQSPEAMEATLSNVISMLSRRLSLMCWSRPSREIWEQALVLLIISSSRPLITMQKAVPFLPLKKLFTDKFTHLQSHLIITCNTIRIVLDEWMKCVLGQDSDHPSQLTNFPDYSAYQMHLRELVPYAFSPIHSLRIISQSFFLRMWSEGELLLKAMRTSGIPGHSFIHKAILSVSISSSLLDIFKISLESTDIVKRYASLLELLDPRTEALCMTSAAAYVDSYYPTPNISAVAGNVVTTLDEAAAEDTRYKKAVSRALASLDLGHKGCAQLEDHTKHEAMWGESYGAPHEDNYQQKIHSIGKSRHNSSDLSTKLIINASLLDKTTNLGGLARTAEIFGLESLVLGNASFATDPSFKAMSMTADMWLKIEEVQPHRLIQWIAEKKKDGYSIVCLEQSSRSVYLQDAELPQKAVLVLGNERNGCPEEILSLCDMTVEIQQIGNTRSLNVHVSCAIFTWKWACQHRFATAERSVIPA